VEVQHTRRAIGACDDGRHSLAAAEEVVQRRAAAGGSVHLGRRAILSPWPKRSLRRRIHRGKRRRQGSEGVATDREEVAAVLPLRPEVVVGLAAADAGRHLLHLATLRRCRCCHRLPRFLLRRGRLGRRRASAEQVVQRALPATVAHAAATTHGHGQSTLLLTTSAAPAPTYATTITVCPTVCCY
jgi:hypothetical protein